MNRDNRVQKRRHLIYYLRVWDVASGEIIGHVADLTTEGFMLVSEQPVEVGRSFHLEVQWRDDEQEEHQLRFHADSLWCRNDVNPDFYDTGFRLAEQNAAILAPLGDIIEEMGFDD